MSHRIVVVGGGAGGLELATKLGRKLGKKGKAKITLVDANLTHIWKPLLHEVATGSLNNNENELNYVAQAKWNFFEFQIGKMCGINRETKQIELAATLDDKGKELVPSRHIYYDTLIIAVGSITNDFGTPGAKEHCLFLDTQANALDFHRQLLAQYLTAQATADEGEGAKKDISIAIVGAGATGVELAAELRNASQMLSSYGLDKIKPEDMTINVIEAGPRILPALSEKIAQDVHRELLKIDVRVLTNSSVADITATGLTTKDGKHIPANLKVWAAGVRCPDFLKDFGGLETNRINQIVVNKNLQSTRDENIFALGDCAACALDDGSGRNVPPRAQAAHQQASLLAKTMKLRIEGKTDYPEYTYKDYGSLVSLSRFSAVGNLMGTVMRSVNVEGWLARMFYISLYRLHQIALYGFFRTGLLMISDNIGKRTHPRMKLH